MNFLTDNLGQLNWFAVLVAVISTMPVGYVWYDLKIGFGRRWSEAVGLTKEQIDSSSSADMTKTFGAMLTTSLFTAIVLGALMRAVGVDTLGSGLLFGLVMGLVIRGGAHVIHNGFAKKPAALTAIDAGHDALSIIVMCGILGVWQ